MTISTDARTTSATSLTREFNSLRSSAGWTVEQESLAQQHAARAAFTATAEITATEEIAGTTGITGITQES